MRPAGDFQALAALSDDASRLQLDDGATRQASVAAALAAVPERYRIVLVHDAARALAPAALVEAVAAAVRAGAQAVIPVLPVVDTIKEVVADAVVGTVDRSVLRPAWPFWAWSVSSSRMFEAVESISPFCGFSADAVPAGRRALAEATPLRTER